MFSKAINSKIKSNSTAVQLPRLNRRSYTLANKINSNPKSKLFSYKTQSPKQRIITEPHIQASRISQQGIAYGVHCQSILLEQTKAVNKLFNKIVELRQNNGVIPYRDGDQNFEDQQIPYNPEKHEMNQQIRKIKVQIEEKMTDIFKIAKHYPKLKQLISGVLSQKMESSIDEHCHSGRVAAMKAHRRLIDANRLQLKKIGLS